MTTTETKEAAKTASEIPTHDLLAGIKVELPSNVKEKTRKYLCGIRRTDENKRFEFQVRVGPVTFATQTFKWEGQGDDAKQVFMTGAVYELSDEQVLEIRQKLQHRYLRPVSRPQKDGPAVITGYEDVDASDGGALDPVSGARTPPKRIPSRLRGDEIPLLTLLVFERCHENAKLGGRVLTLAEIEEMRQEALAEEARDIEGGEAYFEGGKGGKQMKSQAQASRDAKTQRALSTTDGKNKAEGGFLPG